MIGQVWRGVALNSKSLIAKVGVSNIAIYVFFEIFLYIFIAMK